MFNFGKKKSPGGSDSAEDKASQPSGANAKDTEDPSRSGFFGRLKAGLNRTRANLSAGLDKLVSSYHTIDDTLLEEVETRLITADVGVEATDLILNNLRHRLKRKQLHDSGQFIGALKEELTALLNPVDIPLDVAGSKPFVILVVGVNGVGKTTTIGKLCKRFQSQGLKPLLAAGDTFRAAAVEQLQEWGQRNDVPVIAQASGADSASVIFDAYQAAKARGADILIADTAGRLHTKDNLMHELEKIVRVLKKLDEKLPQEILLVVDATTGQNALSQARHFHESVTLTGLCLTKLDGTAKGGMVFAIAKQLGIPIRFIGVGEKIDDLRPFSAQHFVDALFAE